MKSIAVIGGSGFIGWNICKAATASGYKVTCFDRVKAVEDTGAISFVKGDYYDDNALKQLISEHDIIVQALSIMNPSNSNDTYHDGYGKEFMQTIRLMEMIIEENKRLIFISSGGTVYGDALELPTKEDSPLKPINHYGNLKVCIENTMRIFNKQHKKNMIVVRVSNPYGPGQDYTKSVGFIDAAIKKTLAGETIEIWGDGNVVRDYIYIDDVCNMILSLFEYDGIEDTFNIATGVGTSQNDIIEILREQGLSPKVVYKDKRSIDIEKNILDNSRIKSVYKDEITQITKGIIGYIKILKTVF